MKIQVVVIVVLALLVIGGFSFIYFGVFDIAANHPHSNLTLWFINKTVTQSVKRRARGINPPNLSSPSLIRTGAYHFQQMCVQCHGGPGVERSDAGDGLYPPGPDLARAKKQWAPQEIFWITKNGLKMTGMPTWGGTSSDEEIWAMVAFMEQMSAISPDQYQQMLNAAEEKESTR
jgi:mono/diheme cytochrome c family protein